MSTAWQPTIDGLTLATAEPSHLESAARATLAALDDGDLLGPEHALTVQLVLELSRALDSGLSTGKLSVATSQAVRQLLDAMATLPQPAGGDAEELAAFRAALVKA